MIEYRSGLPKDRQQIFALYEDAGWSSYTREPEVLWQGLQHSQVFTAWHEERLVGLVRGITDQQTILYVQDLLVLQEFQRQGIGRNLLSKLITAYPNIRQKVLLTDDTKKTRDFYKACSFQSVDKMNTVAFLYQGKS